MRASDDATGQPEACLALNSICHRQVAAQGPVRPPPVALWLGCGSNNKR